MDHDGGPPGSTEVHADSLEDPQVVIRELLQVLSLPGDAVSWIRDAPIPER